MKPPLKPPKSWFSAPRLDGPTALTVEASGRLFGHVAAWGTCHTGFPGVCVQPPPSRSGYAYFHTGQVETEEGQLLNVGRITLRTRHAELRYSAQEAAAHYDHTGYCAAVVRAGEDAWGIWHAGAFLPHVSDTDVAEFRRNPPSGDWRSVNGHLELIGTLCVNLPGYPVVRASAAHGEVRTLVAAGALRLTDEDYFFQLQRLRARVNPEGALEALSEHLGRRLGR